MQGKVWSIDENRLLLRVLMDVPEGMDSTFTCVGGFDYGLQEVSDCIRDWIQFGFLCLREVILRHSIGTSCHSSSWGKLPVHIFTNESCPCITNYNSVRVSHRYDLKDQSFPQFVCHPRFRDEETYQPMDDPTRTGLTRVQPRLDEHNFPSFLPVTVIKVCDRK